MSATAGQLESLGLVDDFQRYEYPLGAEEQWQLGPDGSQQGFCEPDGWHGINYSSRAIIDVGPHNSVGVTLGSRVVGPNAYEFLFLRMPGPGEEPTGYWMYIAPGGEGYLGRNFSTYAQYESFTYSPHIGDRLVLHYEEALERLVLYVGNAETEEWEEVVSLEVAHVEGEWAGIGTEYGEGGAYFTDFVVGSFTEGGEEEPPPEEGPDWVRSFALGGVVRTAIGAADTAAGAAMTYVALVKFGASESSQWMIARQDASHGSASQWSSLGREPEIHYYPSGQDAGFSCPTNEWVLVVGVKPAGSTKAIYYYYRFSTKTWASAESTNVFSALHGAAPAEFQLGRWNGGEQFVGRYAAAMVLGSALSKAQVEALVSVSSQQGWLSLSPLALWQFKQSSVEEAVPDITGNGAGQKSREGTAAVKGTIPIPYEAGAGAKLPLAAASGVASCSLGLTAKTTLPLAAASGAASATLSLTGKVNLPLGASSGDTAPFISLGLTVRTFVPMTSTTGSASTSLGLTAATKLPLASASGVATTSLGLAARTMLPLASSSGVATTTLGLKAKTLLPLGASSGVATTTLLVRHPQPLILAESSGRASPSVELRARTFIALAPAAGVATASARVRIYYPPGLYVRSGGAWVSVSA